MGPFIYAFCMLSGIVIFIILAALTVAVSPLWAIAAFFWLVFGIGMIGKMMQGDFDGYLF